MYRRGGAHPGKSILRIGSVDDFHLMETKLRPRVQQYVNTRLSWVKPVEGVAEYEGTAFGEEDPSPVLIK